MDAAGRPCRRRSDSSTDDDRKIILITPTRAPTRSRLERSRWKCPRHRGVRHAPRVVDGRPDGQFGGVPPPNKSALDSTISTDCGHVGCLRDQNQAAAATRWLRWLSRHGTRGALCMMVWRYYSNYSAAIVLVLQPAVMRRSTSSTGTAVMGPSSPRRFARRGCAGSDEMRMSIDFTVINVSLCLEAGQTQLGEGNRLRLPPSPSPRYTYRCDKRGCITHLAN